MFHPAHGQVRGKPAPDPHARELFLAGGTMVHFRSMPPGSEFDLYDLRIEVETIEGRCTCDMRPGDCFELRSGKIHLPANASFCLYALQSAIPLLPAKQRKNHPADWIETDSRVVCPDPACRLTLRIDRIGQRRLHHDDVSAIPISETEADR